MRGPFDLYHFLPRTNCGECGEKTCIAFATQLIERALTPNDCPYLTGKMKETLLHMTRPAVREMTFGSVKIGGEDVMYRHEFTYFNPTAIAIDVSDRAGEDETRRRVEYVTSFRHERIGEALTLQAVAVRNDSCDPDVFRECVKQVVNCTKSLVYCSFNPPSLEAALTVHGDALLYAATSKTWEQVGELALTYKCPLVAYADDLSELESLVGNLEGMELHDIAADPGTHPENFAETLSRFVSLRKAAVGGGLPCPIVGVPAAFSDPMEEAAAASMMVARFADLIIFHTTEAYALLPVLTLRQNIYTDPRTPAAVDPGLRVIGSPTECSPVLCTTNFALTYHTVVSDIEAGKVDCYLIVIDTGGLGVESSAAGGQLNALKARESVEKAKVEEKVHHRKLIIPGLAARIAAELEQLSGWEVVVGPRDSSEIPAFIAEKWG